MTRVSTPGSRLTDLETTVLRHAADGRTIEATARLIDKSMPAVQDARHRLMGKLGATSLVNAVHLAWQAGILRRERHGDHAGYAAHTYRGEDPCDLCKAGERKYRNDLRNKPKEAAA
ncbi:LuxR C-terminal-related transcriptional regulator [Streptomyces sp. R28]|uniref:LuxR C-terminal-related transcriptional regulator n=1 Tax=Streptomyces sp. R28 TaxID=3238628 RepID=A0AB39PVU7_9ACTN